MEIKVLNESKVIVSKDTHEVIISFENDGNVSVSVRQPQRQQEQRQPQRQEESREEREQAQRREERREEESPAVSVPAISSNDNTHHNDIHVHQSGNNVELATQKQVKLVNLLVSRLNIQNRDERLALLSSIVKRPLSSSKELTKTEASRVIDELQNQLALKEFEQIFG